MRIGSFFAALLFVGGCAATVSSLPPIISPVVVPACHTLPLIVAVYRDLLSRAPDDFGIDYYGERLCDGRMDEAAFRADVMASPEYKVTHPPDLDDAVDFPLPVVTWGGVTCASYYTSMTDPDLNVAQFAAFLQETGVTCTRAWLLDAWALGEREPSGDFKRGQYDGFIPVLRSAGAGSPWDLDRWNDAYFSELRSRVLTLNRAGVWPHLTLLELYTWSEGKADLPFVPDRNKQPYRFNVNGVQWGEPDDKTFGAEQFDGDPARMPDRWMRSFICKVVDTLSDLAWAAEVGNEMPEKAMHFRLLDALRSCGWTGEVTTNRNEDTPGQYWNMGVNHGEFDRIAIHNMLDLSYLDVEYPREAGAGRPTTFRAMWPQVDAARLILSSDGGGGRPEYQASFTEVARDALSRGANVEIQLALKRNRFYGDGSLRMADLEIDRAFLLAVIAPVVPPEPPPPTIPPSPTAAQPVDAYSGFRHVEVAGGWYADALPTGEYVVLVADTGLQTHLGMIPFRDARHQPLYPRITAVGDIRIAGQSWNADDVSAWSNASGWVNIPTVACGVYPVIYDAGGYLHISDCSIGSQGWRYVEPETGRLVTGDETYGPSPRTPRLYEWTDLGGGLFVGQGEDGGAVIWDGAQHRSLAAGNIRFIHGSCTTTCAIAMWRVGRPSLVVWATPDELRALPVWR